MYLTHQLIPGPQEQWRHLEKNYLGTLEHIKKKKKIREALTSFSPLPDTFLGAKVLWTWFLLKLRTLQGAWQVDGFHMSLRIWALLSTCFFSFSGATHFSGWIWKNFSLWRVGKGAWCLDPLFSLCLLSCSMFPWQGNASHVFLFSS